MKTIPLTQGQVALVDDGDYEWLMQYKWFTFRNKQGKIYAARKQKVGVNRWTTVYMARQILGFPPSGVDHIKGEDTLNNTRLNLRPATKQQNAANTAKRRDNTSGFKGVTWHRVARKWMAHIRVNGRDIYLGLHSDLSLAARIYDDAARKHFGEFARTNDQCVTA
jgi:hypothetical protein